MSGRWYTGSLQLSPEHFRVMKGTIMITLTYVSMVNAGAGLCILPDHLVTAHYELTDDINNTLCLRASERTHHKV